MNLNSPCSLATAQPSTPRAPRVALSRRVSVEAYVSAQQSTTEAQAWVSDTHANPCRPCNFESSPPQRARAFVSLIWRIKNRGTFQLLARSGARARQGPVVVRFLPNDAAGHPAYPPSVGYVVSRRVGGAVTRNRVRRRLRAGVHLHRAMLVDGATYLVSAQPEAAHTKSSELHEALCGALSKAQDALMSR